MPKFSEMRSYPGLSGFSAKVHSRQCKRCGCRLAFPHFIAEAGSVSTRRANNHIDGPYCTAHCADAAAQTAGQLWVVCDEDGKIIPRKDQINAVADGK